MTHPRVPTNRERIGAYYRRLAATLTTEAALLDFYTRAERGRRFLAGWRTPSTTVRAGLPELGAARGEGSVVLMDSRRMKA